MMESLLWENRPQKLRLGLIRMDCAADRSAAYMYTVFYSVSSAADSPLTLPTG